MPGIPCALQLALVLALLGCLLQPHGPHRPPPRWHVAAAAAEAPGDLNFTQLRWVLGWSCLSLLDRAVLQVFETVAVDCA